MSIKTKMTQGIIVFWCKQGMYMLTLKKATNKFDNFVIKLKKDVFVLLRKINSSIFSIVYVQFESKRVLMWNIKKR